MSVENRFIDLVAKHLNVNPNFVKPESSFVDDLNSDSLQITELTMAVEEDFAIKIPDEDAVQIRTVQEALDYIKRKMA